LLFCYHYDPATGKYGAVVMNIIRLAGIATIIGIVVMLLLLKRLKPTYRQTARSEIQGWRLCLADADLDSLYSRERIYPGVEG